MRLVLLPVALFTKSLCGESLINLNFTGVGGAALDHHGFGAGESVNDSGQVTGQTLTTGGILSGFLYSSGTMIELGTGENSLGRGINSSGQIVGQYQNSHAFVYSNGVITDLGTLGQNFSAGYGINDSGQTTGVSNVGLGGAGPNHAFFSSNGVMTDLGTSENGNSWGRAINNSGEVTGDSSVMGAEHAFISSGGAMTDLGTLGGISSDGFEINDVGQVTGRAALVGDQYSDAFIYSNGVMNDLGSLSGHGSIGWGINESAQVVGVSVTADGQFHGFLYTDGAMLDLNTVYSSLLSNGTKAGFLNLNVATAISDDGYITGFGSYFDGAYVYGEAFLLDTRTSSGVPDSGVTGFLFGSALLGCGLMRRRWNQK